MILITNITSQILPTQHTTHPTQIWDLLCFTPEWMGPGSGQRDPAPLGEESEERGKSCLCGVCCWWCLSAQCRVRIGVLTFLSATSPLSTPLSHPLFSSLLPSPSLSSPHSSLLFSSLPISSPLLLLFHCLTSQVESAGLGPTLCPRGTLCRNQVREEERERAVGLWGRERKRGAWEG
jgi:hypothetical protein